MSESLPKVFLSSTIYDLRDLRDAVQTALRKEGYTVLASEDGSIQVDSSKHSYDVCLEAAKTCDCLVAVIGGRFGGTMPDGKTSITQITEEHERPFSSGTTMSGLSVVSVAAPGLSESVRALSVACPPGG